MTVDQTLRLHAAGDPLQPLHRRLYQRNAKHAGGVYYALVCRCVLGTPTRAKNGVSGAPPRLALDPSRSTSSSPFCL